MKLGIIISASILLLVGLIFLLAMAGPADRPTSATSPDKLTLQMLPSVPLPGITQSDDVTPSQEDAAVYYQQALDYYQTHEADFDNASNHITPHSKTITDLLFTGLKAGKVQKGFYDKHIQLAPLASTMLTNVLFVALDRGTQLIDEKQYGQGQIALQAGFDFARRTWRQNHRLPIRYAALEAMGQILETLASYHQQLQGLDPEALDFWLNALDPLRQNWRAKYEMTHRIRPPIGDMLNMAKNDQDISFQVEAILVLGLAKHNPKHKGNLNAIEKLINQAINDPQPQIAQAAKVANDLTKDDLNRLKL